MTAQAGRIEPIDAVVRAEPLDFGEFFEREHLRLGRAIYLLVGHPGEAEDLVQEALARAYERWDRVSKMTEPAGYVYRIAANLYRRRLRARRVLDRISEQVRVQRHSDPMEAADVRVDLLSALRALPTDQRVALILVEMLGYDAESAAGILGIKPVSVRVRVHRARLRLREELGGFDV